MKRYIGFVLLVLVFELGLLFGISIFFDTDLLSTMFFGSILFSVFAFILGSSGDVFSAHSHAATFEASGGNYKPNSEKLTLKIGPLLSGSILCFIVYIVMEVVM
ncbi:hypothetical protein [Litchfieldia salsa]|uniref:Uncharacterized protein n=1 Tax=Litchfieldia salsa TaxID=930152 RepID=A0A1H0SQY9_9BACI|nr:hypothetical protein [Litchfieldia salsa]SDP44170.1 hypothetical protein SAMN05216565_10374 [Litchfieldia salsa]